MCTFPAQVAAVRQLEESKTKIESLLDWLSEVDKDSEREGTKHMQVIEQNGTHFQEGDGKSEIGEEDEVNGNLLETDVDGRIVTTEGNLNQQYQKVKVCCFRHNTLKFLSQFRKDRNNLVHTMPQWPQRGKSLFAGFIVISNINYCESSKHIKNNEKSLGVTLCMDETVL